MIATLPLGGIGAAYCWALPPPPGFARRLRRFLFVAPGVLIIAQLDIIAELRLYVRATLLKGISVQLKTKRVQALIGGALDPYPVRYTEGILVVGLGEFAHLLMPIDIGRIDI